NSKGQIVGLRGTVQDITERKQAELALVERNTQLALAGKAGLVATFTYDVKTERVQISEGYAAIYGFPEGTTEIARDQWRALVLPDDLERLESVRNQAFADRQREYGLEYRIVLPDRGLRWIETRSFISYDGEGWPQRVAGVDIDVTERRLTEQALADRNRQLELAGTVTLVARVAIEVDPALKDFTLQRMQGSPGFATIYGLPEKTAEISLGDWRALVHPEDLPPFLASRQRAYAERCSEHHAEFRILRPCGTIRWIEGRSFIEYDQAGHPKRLVGVNIDVTERKQVEQALADRNRQLELAAKHALVGRFATEIDVARGDLKSQRAQVSPGVAAIYGLPEETTEIAVGDWRSLVHSDDLPQYLEHSQKVFAERRGDHHAEFRIVRPCGTIRWIEARSFIDYDQAGHARRLVGVNIDITERKRAEEARKILNAELDHRVKNALATVTAVISHTRVGSRSVADFVAALEGRIRSMATTHELLSSRWWQGVSLTELVRREL